jgi:endonuclease III
MAIALDYDEAMIVANIDQKRVVTTLLDCYGITYAQEIGIRLQDKPSPLFQLLFSALLMSARISAANAVQAAKALVEARLTTPERMVQASWQDRVDVITRHGYKRYDERTSTMLGNTSELLIGKYNGDLRKLRDEAQRDVKREHQLLQQFSGIGPVGADIFLREVQPVWTETYPYADKRVIQAARRLGLGTSAQALSKLVPRNAFTRLVAALVRTELAKDYDQILKAAA